VAHKEDGAMGTKTANVLEYSYSEKEHPPDLTMRNLEMV